MNLMIKIGLKQKFWVWFKQFNNASKAIKRICLRRYWKVQDLNRYFN